MPNMPTRSSKRSDSVSASTTSCLHLKDSSAMEQVSSTSMVCSTSPEGNGNEYWQMVTVEFRLVVFRPFKHEVITGRISSANEAGIRSKFISLLSVSAVSQESLLIACSQSEPLSSMRSSFQPLSFQKAHHCMLNFLSHTLSPIPIPFLSIIPPPTTSHKKHPPTPLNPSPLHSPQS